MFLCILRPAQCLFLFWCSSASSMTEEVGGAVFQFSVFGKLCFFCFSVMYLKLCHFSDQTPYHGGGGTVNTGHDTIYMVWGGVETPIRYTHCISTLCRLSTLPQYYKPPPHHRGGGNPIHYHNTTNHPHTTGGGGNPLLPPPMGGEGGGGPANTAPYIMMVCGCVVWGHNLHALNLTTHPQDIV